MHRKIWVLIGIGLYATPAWAQQLPPVSTDEAVLHVQLGQTEFLLGRRMQEILQLQQQLADLKAKKSEDPPSVPPAPQSK